ncbi:energy-coupling factor ABC transporter ATP-binding protein [Microlunatus ginsengisoli]|uniref:ABC transporter ATP-binding protein n=1 Tax=Microlunatus ginsengisoli TaxID=363863 RepID=A0ABP6ZG20_9ACTN
MLIELAGVTHHYGDRLVLSEVTATLTEHRIGVIGANGSGKSTFARLLNGLLVPDAGSVTLDGLDTARDARAIRRRVGFCFTDPDAQIVMPTVAEDVAFGLRRLKLPRAEQRERVRAALARAGLSEHADHPAHLLSGGQKQLLALTSVLVTEPDLLVLDEPTTLLDLRNTRRIAAVVETLPQQVVLVSHDLDLLAGFDRVLVFDEARLVVDAAPDEAITRYRSLMTSGAERPEQVP